MSTTPSCTRCGEPITPGARFCQRCGSDVSGEQGGVATAMMPAAGDADRAALDLLRQATLGEYEILSELGRGGMATVYLAHDIALDRKVAIKVMSPALLLMGEGMAERFKREARTAASLSHPHIIPIHAVKSQGRVLYFVMKFIAGRSLESIIREVGALPIPMVQAILHQVGGALGYAHRRHVIHRDIKPANIMVDDEGWAVVTDFGIAKVAETRGLTMTGIAVGTPSYMSPEQCAAKDITGKSDQYSLGVVAYEMLTGKQPFDADSAMAIMFAHFHEQPKPIEQLRADCPPALAAAVMRMLEKAPDQRWPSIEDAVGAMGGAPLAHDDPIRDRMIELVRSSVNQRALDAVVAPPTSPVPPAREDPTTPIPTPRIASITISPATSSVSVGDPVQLTATSRATGGTSTGGPVAWASSNPAIATVSPGGLVSAVGAGTVTITATAEGVVGRATVTVTPVPVGSVTLVPAEHGLAPKESVHLVATARDSHGHALGGRSMTWVSSNPAVATVTPQGLVTALSVGSATISARCEGVDGDASITVAPAPVANLTIAGAPNALTAGESVALRAAVTDQRGQPLQDRPIEWTSSNPGVATVTPKGVVVGVTPGSVVISASAEGKSGTVTLAVKPAPVASVTIAPPAPLMVGASIRLSAVLKDGHGTVLTGREIVWTSGNPAVASVSSEGVLTGVSPGATKITAVSEHQSWTVSVTVTPMPVHSIELTGPGALTEGEKAQLVVRVLDANGAVLSGRPVQWKSSDSRIVTVTGSGLASAQRTGTATITAASEGKEGSVHLTVSARIESPLLPDPGIAAAETVRMERVQLAPAAEPEAGAAPVALPPADRPRKRLGVVLAGLAIVAGGAAALIWGRGDHGAAPGPNPKPPAVPVASVAIWSPPSALPVGGSFQLLATVADPSGSELHDRAVAWTSSDSAIARVSETGLVTAVGPGSATLIAASEGKSDTVTVTITAPRPAPPTQIAVASVAIAPPPKSLDVGATAQLSATARDARGNSLYDRRIAWSTGAPAVAKVSETGLVTAVSAGMAKITATSESKSAAVYLSINPPKPPPPAEVPVHSVSLSPGEQGLREGESVDLVAAVKGAKGEVLEQRSVAWASTDPRVASVSPAGVVTAVGPGTATVTATVEGKTASARITVTSVPARAPVVSVTVSRPARPITLGETVSLSAVAKDQRGNPLSDRAVSWTSSNTEIATVSPAGVVTGVGPGSVTIAATVETEIGSTVVTVTKPAGPPPAPAPVGVASIAIPPVGKSLKPGESAQLSAMLKDQRGGLLADRTVAWASSNGSVARVSGTGLVSAVAAGSAEITASVEGKSASVTVTVAAAPSPAPTPPPAAAAGTSGSVPLKGLAAGNLQTCGRLANGGVACWGAGATSPAVLGGGSDLAEVSVGGAHGCGLTAAGRAYCWGENRNGQLGDGSTSNRSEPVAVFGEPKFTQIVSGGNHSCGLAGGGKAFCWGKNDNGQVGDGSTENRKKPSAVIGNIGFQQLAAGGAHTCGITGAGKAYCWGDGWSGALGYGPLAAESSPVEVSGDLKFSQLALGGNHSCGLSTQGKAYCWGDNRAGQLGDGSTSDRSKPVPVAGNLTFESLSAGGSHSCGLTTGGQIYCWGENKTGELGDGSKSGRSKPVPVTGDHWFSALAAGASHTCGVTRSNVTLCWGANSAGQLGDGSKNPRSTPGPVAANP